MSGQKPKTQGKLTQQLAELPPIPNKLYFSIGEVSKLCVLKSHVLRYWEQEFSELSPTKRRGNRRYYQRKDVLLIRRIKSLLYDQGYTIEGARAQMSSDHMKNESSSLARLSLKETIADLESVLAELES